MSGWIPVTEKLPEWHWTTYMGERCTESEPVLVCCKEGKGHYHRMAVATYGDGHWECMDDYFAFVEDDDIVAWMPLPEPYVAERKESWV